ncbi:MAG: phosphoglucosamine mutase [Bacteroidetes bacterium]|nr:phosphoglucosamine mutase [Bacteroidota bacterium]
MPLIKSISGIRGTIGGAISEGLNPVNVALFASAFGIWIKSKKPKDACRVVTGRDARTSGEAISRIVSGALMSLGIDVIDCGPAPTPTVEMAVKDENGDGGIIITASHNPAEWNALKLLNERGEFISEKEGRYILSLSDNKNLVFPSTGNYGNYSMKTDAIEKHISAILALPAVDAKAIRSENFRIVLDAVNSVGGIAVPLLLDSLGVKETIKIHCNADGNFPHNPEPLPENLGDLSSAVQKFNADAGFAVDPDVDRLAIVSEDGSFFGEEYTLVSVADYILGIKKGNTVSNLSSTRALKDITVKRGGKYFASAVGEVNVVEMMKKQKAVIGGEGNGGVIYPELHYGRDALVGIALFLTQLAKSGKSCSDLRKTFPDYYISKNKIALPPKINIEKVFSTIEKKYKKYSITKSDGLKIDFETGWVHLRKSNTEPVMRIYSESRTKEGADGLADALLQLILI